MEKGGGGEKPIHFSPEEEEEEEAGPEYKARGLRRRRMWQIFFSPLPPRRTIWVIPLFLFAHFREGEEEEEQWQ